MRPPGEKKKKLE